MEIRAKSVWQVKLRFSPPNCLPPKFVQSHHIQQYGRNKVTWTYAIYDMESRKQTFKGKFDCASIHSICIPVGCILLSHPNFLIPMGSLLLFLHFMWPLHEHAFVCWNFESLLSRGMVQISIYIQKSCLITWRLIKVVFVLKIPIQQNQFTCKRKGWKKILINVVGFSKEA